MVLRSAVTVHPIQQLRDEVDRLVTNVFTNPTVAGAARLERAGAAMIAVRKRG